LRPPVDRGAAAGGAATGTHCRPSHIHLPSGEYCGGPCAIPRQVWFKEAGLRGRGSTAWSLNCRGARSTYAGRAEEDNLTDKPRLVYVTYIQSTPEKVWHALTDADLCAEY